MAHIHNLKNNQVTGEDQVVISGDHVHSLPNGELTSADPEGPTHTHTLPDGSKTPSGPIPVEDLNKEG